MAGTVNIREIVLGVLMEVTEGEAYSHIALRNTLEKYQYLPKYDRAFISRVTEGTLENLIQIDYIIETMINRGYMLVGSDGHVTWIENPS